MAEQKVPKLRFKGFIDNWEQRKLKDIVKRVTRKNKKLESRLPLTISAQDGLINQTNFFNKQVASKKLENYLLLKRGEFAYNKSYSNGYPFGAIKRLNRYNMGVLSSLYIAFKPEKINSNFLEQYFETNKWNKEIYKRASEGARNHGLLNISPTDFFELGLKVANSTPEQEKISKLLISLDNTISLQQHKIASLNQVKTALLQKMFADEDQTKPILRFKGYTDDWEQRKLGNISHRIKGNDGRMKLPLLTISARNGWMTQKKRFSNNIAGKEKKNYTLLKRHQLSYNHGNSKLAKYGTVFELSNYSEALVPKVYHSFAMDSQYSSTFIENYFHTKKLDRQLRKYISSTARMDGLLNINFDDFIKIKVNIPNFKEQCKIASVLTQLQENIDLQQRKLKKLKRINQFLLQNMFI